MADQAPFIPGAEGEDAIPEEPWRVFGTGSFFRLWLSQVLSSLGDWIGLLAILALANTISESNAAALSLVMVARMLPGFLLAPLVGALVDRLDRKRVMVFTDVGRAVLLALLPFVDNLLGLVLASFILELFALFRGPATAATVPHLVPEEHLPQANSLSLVAAFGTFPLGALMFAGLAGLAHFVNGFEFISLDREQLALYFDAAAFAASALITMTLPIPKAHVGETRQRIKVTQTLRDVKEGLQFIAGHELVRGVIYGLAGGLLGGGMIIPLGPVFSNRVLHEGTSGFGLLMFALGLGAAIGVIGLALLQKRAPLETVFWVAIVTTGAGIAAAASFSALVAAMFVTVLVGAAAGTGYVSGFTLLQRHSHDEVRGRTFAALYTLIRVCLLLALTVTPLLAGAGDELSKALFDDGVIEVGGQAIGLPGVRLALWLGGIITLGSGLVARREMRQAHRKESL
ncbi:MAG TPA: MFS transporter [Acidimicrobiia bacterium]|nr:MFS transporter [Acidimicrobiia bacterium]